MAKKKMTIEGLATLMQREFHDIRKDMNESLGILQDDIKDIKGSLGPLVKVIAAQESDIKNLHIRVYRLERKVGLAK